MREQNDVIHDNNFKIFVNNYVYRIIISTNNYLFCYLFSKKIYSKPFNCWIFHIYNIIITFEIYCDQFAKVRLSKITVSNALFNKIVIKNEPKQNKITVYY